MKKRVISIVLTVALLLSVASVGLMSVSAADQNSAASGADESFYFTIPDFWIEQYGFVPGTGAGTTTVYCHVFQIGNLDPDFVGFSWQTRNELCTYDPETGKYVYKVGEKFKNTPLKDDADYGVIFSAKNTSGNKKATQTYDLTMGTDCYGDEVYVVDTLYQNPMDSQQSAYATYWKNEDNAAKYGPHAGITSLGVLQGEKYAPHEDKVLAVANFIKDYNANIPTNEDPQVCVTLCTKLEVEPYDVYAKYEALYSDLIEAGTIPDLQTVAGYLGLAYPPEPPSTTTPTETEPTDTTPTETEPTDTTPTETEPTDTTPTETEPTDTTPTDTEPTDTTPTETEPTDTTPTETEPTDTTPTDTEPTDTTPTDPVPTYYVAGDFFENTWIENENPMTPGNYEFDGQTYDYALTVPDVASGSWAFKITDGHWNTPDETFHEISNNGQNFTFVLTDACDVTIYLNSESKTVVVDAEFLGKFELEYIMAVGNGDGPWLNGKAWDLTAQENMMTEISRGVWSITYEGIEQFNDYQVKFACNGSWTPYNWTSDGILDGQENPSILVPFNNATVTLTIDVNGFDFETGEGSVDIDINVKNAEGFELGDVNKDGVVNVVDATILQINLAKLTVNSVYDETLADYNRDGFVNVLDVTYIQLATAGLLK